MSTVQEIESAIAKLKPEELRQVQEWLEDFAEDRLEFTPEFEAGIRESEREMAAGLRPRVHQPETRVIAQR
ncbi:MAG: hypothetical protein RLZZ15_582 [Verrucomicrobiota bacterium]|jgi:hypothetical protein